jgi:hypothetical protein
VYKDLECIGFCSKAISYSSHVYNETLVIRITLQFGLPLLDVDLSDVLTFTPNNQNFTFDLSAFKIDNSNIFNVTFAKLNGPVIAAPNSIWLNSGTILSVEIPQTVNYDDTFTFEIKGLAYKDVTGSDIIVYAGNQDSAGPVAFSAIWNSIDSLLTVTEIYHGVISLGITLTSSSGNNNIFFSGTTIIGFVSGKGGVGTYRMSDVQPASTLGNRVNISSIGIFSTSLEYPTVKMFNAFSKAEMYVDDSHYALSSGGAKLFYLYFNFSSPDPLKEDQFINFNLKGFSNHNIFLDQSFPIGLAATNLKILPENSILSDPIIRVSFSVYVNANTNIMLRFGGVGLPIDAISAGQS